jgi:hypothetical protein
MKNNRVKLTKTDVQEFKPIQIKLEFEIKTQKELEDWKLECSEGTIYHFSTQFSHLMFDVINSLNSIK